MDFRELLENSWKSFTEFLPALLINTLVLLVVTLVTLGILAPVCSAGYIQSLLQVIRDRRKPEVGDLFSHMNLFLPLLALFLVAGVVILFGLVILVLPGIIAALALTFFCLYLLPLMTDKGLGVTDAVRESSRMAMEEPVGEHFAVVAIYLGVNALGQVVPFGIIFTMPFATLFLVYAFEEKTSGTLPEGEVKEAVTPPPPPEGGTGGESTEEKEKTPSDEERRGREEQE